MLEKKTNRFIRKLEGKPPLACVLGQWGPHILGFVRSLGKRGIPVIVASIEQSIRLRSRYCLEAFHIHGESSLLAFIAELGENMPHKGVMIPTSDADVLFMSRNRSHISRYFFFALPDITMLETLANKRTQYEFALDSGILIPQTFSPESPQDILKIADKIEYPCIIKPVYSHVWHNYHKRVGMKGWEKLAEVSSPQELHNTYCSMADAGVELLIQERIPGDDTQLYSFYTYLNQEAEPLTTFVLRKQRQWPPLYGCGSSSVTCKNEDVVALGLKLLQKAKYHGLANLEFKLDSRDGEYKLMEINVRCGNRVRLAVDAGVDIPYIAYKDMLGKAVTPVNTYHLDMQWIDLIGDFRAFLYYRKIGKVHFGQWVRSVIASRSHAYFSWDDPIPFLLHIKQVTMKAASYARLFCL